MCVLWFVDLLFEVDDLYLVFVECVVYGGMVFSGIMCVFQYYIGYVCMYVQIGGFEYFYVLFVLCQFIGSGVDVFDQYVIEEEEW